MLVHDNETFTNEHAVATDPGCYHPLFHAGASLEAGNVWNFRDDIALDDLRYSASVYIGADTPVGPVYFAVGHSDSGDNAVYFYVGDPFTAHSFD